MGLKGWGETGEGRTGSIGDVGGKNPILDKCVSLAALVCLPWSNLHFQCYSFMTVNHKSINK